MKKQILELTVALGIIALSSGCGARLQIKDKVSLLKPNYSDYSALTDNGFGPYKPVNKFGYTFAPYRSEEPTKE